MKDISKIDQTNQEAQAGKMQVNFNEYIEEKSFHIKTDHLSQLQKREVENLIENYKTVFAKNKYDVGTVN